MADATIAWLTPTVVDTSGLTTYTATAHGLGTANADRYIGVIAAAEDTGNGGKTCSTITVNGVTATLLAQIQGASTDSSLIVAAIAAVPTGTSGDIVVTWSEAMARCTIDAFEIHGDINSGALWASSTSVAFPETMTLDIPAKGIAFGGAHYFRSTANTASFTWTGLTETSDTSFFTSNRIATSTAADAFATAQTGLSITATGAGAQISGQLACGVAVSFGPAADTLMAQAWM